MQCKSEKLDDFLIVTFHKTVLMNFEFPTYNMYFNHMSFVIFQF